MDPRTGEVEQTQDVPGVQAGRQPAQGLVEYGLVIGVVGVLAIAALSRFGNDISQMLDRLGTLIRPIAGG